MWVRKNSKTTQDNIFYFVLEEAQMISYLVPGDISVLKVETCVASLALVKSPIVWLICHLKHKCLMDGNGCKAGWAVLVSFVEHLAAATIQSTRRSPVWVPEKTWRKPQPQPLLWFSLPLFLHFFDIWLTKRGEWEETLLLTGLV